MFCAARRFFSRTVIKLGKCCEENTKNPSSPSRINDCQLRCSRPCPTDKASICPPTPKELYPISDESKAKLKFWKNLTYFGAIPAVIIMTVITLYRLEEENKKPRPEFVPMEYMEIHARNFPWGDGKHTIFHNPARNPMYPGGYEVPDPNAQNDKE